VVAPEQARLAYGTVQASVDQFRTDILGEVPSVLLGAAGGNVTSTSATAAITR
jgi:hypothetical protein